MWDVALIILIRIDMDGPNWPRTESATCGGIVVGVLWGASWRGAGRLFQMCGQGAPLAILSSLRAVIYVR